MSNITPQAGLYRKSSSSLFYTPAYSGGKPRKNFGRFDCEGGPAPAGRDSQSKHSKFPIRASS